MKYDFTSIIDRKGKDALAVDAIGTSTAPDAPKDGFNAIPMWVADMNFAAAPSITQAIAKRLEHPVFGYFEPRDEYFSSIIRWQQVRNGAKDLEAKHIGYENGVLGGVISALTAFAAPGDPVLLHSPTYVGFTGCISSSGFHIVHSPMKKDEDGIYRMDFEDMDKKLKEHHIHVAVFCNPHNPCGRAWEQWEIEKAMEVYRANDCIVIADEIWSDIMLFGNKHVPTQSVSEDAKNRTIAIYAPSKTFNLSGLVGSYHIIYNAYLRDRVTAQSEKSHYNTMNVLSMHALIGAYQPEGMEWTDELCQVLTENVDYAYHYIQEHFSGIHISKPQATYMMFLDCSQWCSEHHVTLDEVLKRSWDVGVAWQDGRPFHGEGCIRMNLASPLSVIKEAMGRLKKYVFID